MSQVKKPSTKENRNKIQTMIWHSTQLCSLIITYAFVNTILVCSRFGILLRGIWNSDVAEMMTCGRLGSRPISLHLLVKSRGALSY